MSYQIKTGNRETDEWIEVCMEVAVKKYKEAATLGFASGLCSGFLLGSIAMGLWLTR